MGSRLDLQSLLEGILEMDAVYYQPPPSVRMAYPCIVYECTSGTTEFANNFPYSHIRKYQVTVIDADPDSLIPARVALLQSCIFDRHYTSDNLNHSVFSLYF